MKAGQNNAVCSFKEKGKGNRNDIAYVRGEVIMPSAPSRKRKRHPRRSSEVTIGYKFAGLEGIAEQDNPPTVSPLPRTSAASPPASSNT
jgi:hypothetical protein